MTSSPAPLVSVSHSKAAEEAPTSDPRLEIRRSAGSMWYQRYFEPSKLTHHSGEVLEEQPVVMCGIERAVYGGHIVSVLPAIVQANNHLYLHVSICRASVLSQNARWAVSRQDHANAHLVSSWEL